MARLMRKALSFILVVLMICTLFPVQNALAATPGAGAAAALSGAGGQALPAVAGVAGQATPAEAAAGVAANPAAMTVGSNPVARDIPPGCNGGQSAQPGQPAPAGQPLAGSMAFKGPLPGSQPQVRIRQR